MIRERICAYCGEPIKGKFVEMSVTTRVFANSDMRKVDLHPECFDEVWGKARKDTEDE